MWERLRVQLIHKLGGHTDAESAISGVTDPKERRRLLTMAVKKCFNTIGPEDILQAQGGQWMLEGKPISTQERDRLIAEATNFQDSLLWKVLKIDIRHQANKATFLQGKTEDDLTAGKLWLYTLDVIKTRLKSMGEGTAHYNSRPRK